MSFTYENEFEICIHVLYLFPGTPVICYVKSHSPVKRSQNNNEYFDVVLQMKNGIMRAVCVSPENLKPVKTQFETSSPVRISNYNMKRNNYTGQDELMLNKRAKIDPMSSTDVDFDMVMPTKEYQQSISTVLQILQNKTKNKINIEGRVNFKGPTEAIHTNGKVLTKEEALLTDNTGPVSASDIKVSLTSKEGQRAPVIQLRMHTKRPTETTFSSH